MTSDKLTSKIHQKLFLLLVLLLPTQLGFHFWPDWASIFGIRVDYLSPTIYLTDILVVGILISWWWEEKNKPHIPKYLILIPVYLTVTSLLVSQVAQVSLHKLAKLGELGLLGFYVFHNWKMANEKWKIHIALSVAMVYSCILAWTQFLTGHTLGLWLLGERTFDVNTPGIALVNIEGQDFLRAYATFPHPNVLAGFLLVGILLMCGSCRSTAPWPFHQVTTLGPLPWGPPSRVTHTAILVFVITTLIITFSHSTWIAGLATLFFLKIKWFGKHAKIFTQIMITGAITVSLLFPIFTRDIDTSVLSEEIGKRIDLVRVSALMIADFPMTGVGLGNFIVRLPEYGGTPAVSWWLQPVHNIYLLIFAETGLIGLVMTVSLLFLFMKQAKLKNLPLTAALLVIVATGMTDHYWLTLQQGQLMAGIVFGASIATIKK